MAAPDGCLAVNEEAQPPEDDDEDGLAIGFMFDAETARSKRHFSFPLGGSDVSSSAVTDDSNSMLTLSSESLPSLEVTLLCIDDDPGFVQSGHYIWPAASAMAGYLATNWQRDYGFGGDLIAHRSHDNKGGISSSSSSIVGPSVVELGAGCGLAGIAALHLGARRVVFTDHDPKTLELIRENVALQLEQLQERSESGDTAGLDASTCLLAWGHEEPWPRELEAGGEGVSSSTRNATQRDCDASRRRGTFDLVLATDVIYDSAVVEPLLWTIRELLRPSAPESNVVFDATQHVPISASFSYSHEGCSIVPRALLCGSFKLEDGTDEQMARLCTKLGLKCTLLFDDFATGGCRMHELRNLPSS